VRKNRLNVDFEVGKRFDFPWLVGISASMVTTSIAEGFGLAFLEPWTAGKLLWGRRLKDICADFEKHGIGLDFLYDRLDVPLTWFNAHDFSRQWRGTVLSAARRYGLALSAEEANRAFVGLTGDGSVDFGLLGEGSQRQVLTRLVADPSAKARLVSLNPWLSHPGLVADPSAVIDINRRAVLRHYGMRRYRHRLLSIYEQILNHPVGHRIDKAALRSAFFDLNRFSLLQWGAYAG
jgi:hypothetical protein